MPGGRVLAIHLVDSRGAPLRPVDEAEAVAGRGLVGDRYYADDGTFSKTAEPGKQVTLVESEAIEALARDYAIELEPGASRRNLTTSGVALNHLVGERFRVGGATLRGVELCEPCRYLEGLTRDGVREGLVHRGGLRAEIVEGGTIRVGDPVG